MKDLEYQRVWLARSDPALNYSSLAATLHGEQDSAAKARNAGERNLDTDIADTGHRIRAVQGQHEADEHEDITKSYPSVRPSRYNPHSSTTILRTWYLKVSGRWKKQRQEGQHQ